MKKILLNTLLVAAAISLGACCCTSEKCAPKPTALLDGKALPEGYFSPDGMTIGPDGYIYVSINQIAGDWKFPAKIARISPDDKIEDFYTLPLHAKSKKTSPLGIAFAADGNLYVSDNQTFVAPELGQSGVIRINIKDGKPTGDELVVTGFNVANGMTVRGNYIYVAETDLGTKDKHTSGFYRFSLDELKSGQPLRVTGPGDPHLMHSFETKNKARAVGANGIDFDSKGNLYLTNFGDVEIWKYTFDKDGKIATADVFSRPKGAKSLDGLHVDSEDNIWVADFDGNALVKVCTKTGESCIVAKNAVPTTGSKGEFHSSSECIRRGDKVYMSNIDITMGDNKGERLQTISVVPLK